MTKKLLCVLCALLICFCAVLGGCNKNANDDPEQPNDEQTEPVDDDEQNDGTGNDQTQAEQQAAFSANIENMKPVFDSVLRTIMATDMSFSPTDERFFWITMFNFAQNFGSSYAGAGIDGGYVKVTAATMRQFAAACFNSENLLAIPSDMSGAVSYDAASDSYLVPYTESLSVSVRITNSVNYQNGNYDATVEYFDTTGTVVATYKFELTDNTAANAVFAFSVSAVRAA